MPQLPFVNILTKHVDRHFKVHPIHMKLYEKKEVTFVFVFDC